METVDRKTFRRNLRVPFKRRCHRLWKAYVSFATCLIPDALLARCKMSNSAVRYSWREKIALLSIIVFLWACLAGVTYGLNFLVCRIYSETTYSSLTKTPPDSKWVLLDGRLYHLDAEKAGNAEHLHTKDITNQYPCSSSACKETFDTYNIREPSSAEKIERDGFIDMGKISYTIDDIKRLQYLVYKNKVYDMGLLSETYRKEFSSLEGYRGSDITEELGYLSPAKKRCFLDSAYIGDVFAKSRGCIFTDYVLSMSMLCIAVLIIVRFVLAILYSWMMRFSHRRAVRNKDALKMPVILMVCCYSEGRDGIKTTLDSLCALEYDREKMLLVVVVDGFVTGDANDKSTAEIVLDLISSDAHHLAEPKEYFAVADGAKQSNRALVYSGTYSPENTDKQLSTLLVLKCGSQNEDMISQKPGNRGKRDSQNIIMKYFQRLYYQDRLSDLDFEIYRKMRELKPDIDVLDFEAILMVDSDTRVRPDALYNLVNVLVTDTNVMGLCGETKIINKFESWVSMIQVFEYFVNHHLLKSFESMFGNVTCLPGCFCMYRLFDKRNTKHVTPLLANAFVVEFYSVIKTTTLHQKNLLLLGEDRYLTTLMLKTFPSRSLVFVPSAKCDTYVPSQFKVLLSQRRRWINSTVHNLLELMLINDLCGSFCFSMQFVVVIELIGTLVLPGAIVFTFALIANSLFRKAELIPLVLLGAVFGLPAFLVLFIGENLSNLMWIIVYLASIPIWNLVFPLYSFWNFDDFSWGETRKINVQNKHQKTIKHKETGLHELDLTNEKTPWLSLDERLSKNTPRGRG